MALFASSLLLLVGVLFNGCNSNNRIGGGEPVKAYEYPFIVNVDSADSDGPCGGSLLSKDYPAVILTAAHCIHSMDNQVFLHGDYIGDPNAIKKQVSSTVVHPYYNGNTMENDIALLFIYEDLYEYTQLETIHIDPLSSDESECCSTGDHLTLIGYGHYYDEEPVPKLEEVDLDYLSRDECQNGDFERYSNGMITNSMLCAYTPEEVSCHGVSGGPLIKKGAHYEQVGIVSWDAVSNGIDLVAVGCASRYPGVYTNLGAPSIYNWIQTTIYHETMVIPERLI